jgi:hypothetical protein
MLRRMTQVEKKGRYLPYVIVAPLFALMMLFSGSMKVVQNPEVVEGLGKVGVPAGALPPLGLLLIAGALGLVAGIFRPKLGVAAAAGLVLYFLGAIVTHVIAGDTAGLTAPTVPLLLAALCFVLARKHLTLAG